MEEEGEGGEGFRVAVRWGTKVRVGAWRAMAKMRWVRSLLVHCMLHVAYAQIFPTEARG